MLNKCLSGTTSTTFISYFLDASSYFDFFKFNSFLLLILFKNKNCLFEAAKQKKGRSWHQKGLF